MNQYQAESYDVIVVGAGHAGSEAFFQAEDGIRDSTV